MTKWLSHVPSSFQPLCGKISFHAASIAKEQYKKMKQMDKEGEDEMKLCSGTFTTSVGIPCAHKMKDILETKGLLEPDNFHLQWHLRYNPEANVSTIPIFQSQRSLMMLWLCCISSQNLFPPLNPRRKWNCLCRNALNLMHLTH